MKELFFNTIQEFNDYIGVKNNKRPCKEMKAKLNQYYFFDFLKNSVF